MNDDIDAKLARLNARVQAQSASERDRLERIGFAEVADACRQTFSAKLTYIREGAYERGNPDLMRPGCTWTPYEKRLNEYHEGGSGAVGPVSGSRLHRLPKRRKAKPKHASASPQPRWTGRASADRASGDDSAV